MIDNTPWEPECCVIYDELKPPKYKLNSDYYRKREMLVESANYADNWIKQLIIEVKSQGGKYK